MPQNRLAMLQKCCEIQAARFKTAFESWEKSEEVFGAMKMSNGRLSKYSCCILILAGLIAASVPSFAQSGTVVPKIDIGVGQAKSPEEVSSSLQILFILTILSLAPALLIMLTSFTRIIIVLSFTRSAIGSPQVPPNSVLIGFGTFSHIFSLWRQSGKTSMNMQ